MNVGAGIQVNASEMMYGSRSSKTRTFLCSVRLYGCVAAMRKIHLAFSLNAIINLMGNWSCDDKILYVDGLYALLQNMYAILFVSQQLINMITVQTLAAMFNKFNTKSMFK
jgi:hypothetical protein